MDNLSQDDIDALINGITPAEEPPKLKRKKNEGSQRATPAKSTPNYRLYDFRRPDKLSKEQLRILRTCFGRFTRSVTNYLTGLTRTTVDTNMVEVEQTTYKEIFKSHGIPTLLCTFNLGEESQGLMKFNLNQMYAALDRLMGGPGNGTIINRPLTDFERGLMGEICQKVLAYYHEAVLNGSREIEFESLDADERVISRTMGGEEIMIRALYDLRVGSTTGHLSLYTPLKSLSSLLGKMNRKARGRRGQLKEVIPENLATMPLQVRVELGRTTLGANKLSNLEPGDTVLLDQEQKKPLLVTIGGVPRFEGRAGTLAKRMAVHLEGPWKGNR